MRSDFSLDSPSKVSSHSCKYLEDNICRPTFLLFQLIAACCYPCPVIMYLLIFAFTENII